MSICFLIALKSSQFKFSLKKAYRNRTTHLKFSQEEFIEKLIALVPSPRKN
ncbi:MAG: hypothetical protein HOJ35_09430 [Bdellovibrionales bacterium]|nr:hypothetical protein [Bdellovibrionales bacterium]